MKNTKNSKKKCIKKIFGIPNKNNNNNNNKKILKFLYIKLFYYNIIFLFIY